MRIGLWYDIDILYQMILQSYTSNNKMHFWSYKSMCTSHQITYTDVSQDIQRPENRMTGPQFSYQSNTFWGGIWMFSVIYPKRNVEHLGLYNLYMSKPDSWWKCTPGFKKNNSYVMFWRVHWAEKGGLLKGLFFSIMAMFGVHPYLSYTLQV